MRVGPQTWNSILDVGVLFAIFFMARWQARDLHNNLRISLFFLLIVSVLMYFATYMALVAFFNSRQPTARFARAKAFAAISAIWIFMFVPIWIVILNLSAPSEFVSDPEDQLLAGNESFNQPSSDLARGVKRTSVDACLRLIRCERSPPHKNFMNLLQRRSKCEECISKGKCPSTNAQGEIECIPQRRGLCDKPCVSADILERFAINQNCPNVVAYATAKPEAVQHVEQMCTEDRGMCVYGCDTAVGEDGICTTGWRSYDNEDMGVDIALVDTGQGYPSLSECKRNHWACKSRGCAPAPIAPPTELGTNCYCNAAVRPGRSICGRLASLCDRTSPQYTAARAVVSREEVERDIRSIEQTELAETMREYDASLSTALKF